MRYHSTRNDQNFVDSAEAVLEGLAPDGGLYMPQQIPALDWKQLLTGSSQEISCAILSALLPDIPNMPQLVANAYTGKFETEDLTPSVSVGDSTVLELFRGPTSAFKDVALSMLPDEVCELINLDPAEIEKQRLSGRLRFAEEENGTKHYSIVDIINLKDSIDWKVINRQVESLSFEEEE